jgi:hypothetical protein
MFKVGEYCRTYGGDIVKIVDESNDKGYECVKGSDGKWRYNRKGDYGRITGWSGMPSCMGDWPSHGLSDYVLNPDNLIY